MNPTQHLILKKNSSESLIKNDNKESTLDNFGNDRQLNASSFGEINEPVAKTNLINKKRNRYSLPSFDQSEIMQIKPKEELVPISYNSKLRERGKETSKNDPVKAFYCHQCGESPLIKKILICSNKSCNECYCFSCVNTHHMSYLTNTNIAALKKVSNSGKWKCFKCKSKCSCQKCNPVKKKIVSFIPKETSPKIPGIPLKTTTFKTEKTAGEKEKGDTKPNEIDYQILKLKDKTLIQSLLNQNNLVSKPPIASDKLSKKKKGKNKNNESLSPTSRALDNLNIKETKKKLMVKQCEEYFCDQSKRKSFFKKTCLFCKGQCFNANELLHFRYLKDFLNYVNYLFVYQEPLISYHKEITEENKNILLKDMKELHGAKNKEDWHFSQPKDVCKGCLMILLNKYDGIEIFRKQLMDNKENDSDKEKELEQEKELQLQTKAIHDQIAREMMEAKKVKKEENVIENFDKKNVFNVLFSQNPGQMGPQCLNANSITLEPQNIQMNQQNELQQHNLNIGNCLTQSNQNNNTFHNLAPVFIPQEYIQYFQFLNQVIIQSFNQLVEEVTIINQQYQNSRISKEDIGCFYNLIMNTIKRNMNQGQEIFQKLDDFKIVLFNFMNHLYNLYSVHINEDNILVENLKQVMDQFDQEFNHYNLLMNHFYRFLKYFEQLSFDYLNYFNII